MPNIFLISDTHFGHENMYTFVEEDGTRTRHEFKDATEADHKMIENWNKVVQPTDKVYHLGDVFINRKARFILSALNGKKRLIKGNHDIFPLKDYVDYFDDIRATHPLEDFILSHIPLHTSQVGEGRRFKFNVHGHLHRKVVLDKTSRPDVYYKSVCVEHINYTPIELSEIRAFFQNV